MLDFTFSLLPQTDLLVLGHTMEFLNCLLKVNDIVEQFYIMSKQFKHHFCLKVWVLFQ